MRTAWAWLALCVGLAAVVLWLAVPLDAPDFVAHMRDIEATMEWAAQISYCACSDWSPLCGTAPSCGV